LKVLVPVKRVIDANVKPRVKADGSGIDLANIKMAMNPFDEIAVEEALRQKETGKVSEIVVVSIGVQQAQETLRNALAMGADRAILVETDEAVEPLDVAKILIMNQNRVCTSYAGTASYPVWIRDETSLNGQVARIWQCQSGPTPDRSHSLTVKERDLFHAVCLQPHRTAQGVQ